MWFREGSLDQKRYFHDQNVIRKGCYQRLIYLCFIDYAEAFDKVQHEDLLKLLNSLDLDGKDVRLIRNLYWEQTACMRIDKEKIMTLKLKEACDKVVYFYLICLVYIVK